MSRLNLLSVVIPAFNEAQTIARVVKSIPRRLPGVNEVAVIVVDDYSRDNTSQEARRQGAIVLPHRMNMGAGAATITGLRASRQLGSEAAITLDADGQHDPKEIPYLIDAYLNHQADLVIGSRFLSDTLSQMPPIKRFGNVVMNGVTYAFSGHKVTDSQSGFRLFGRRMLNVVDTITTSGYEFCSETVMRASHLGLVIKEVPITTLYFNDRRGQNPLNGINIVLKLCYKAICL